MRLRYKALLVAPLLAPSIVGDSVAQNRVPPPLDATSCSVTAPPRELPNARFERKGGQKSNAKVIYQRGQFTIRDVTQGRNLDGYDKLTLVGPNPNFAADSRVAPLLARARTFLFEHWRDHKKAYLSLTLSSVDATSTSHVFLEPDNIGRWRVAWRIVRQLGEVDDLPTYYSIQWVIPGGFRKPGTALPAGQQPDPVKDRLEFRDVCGDVDNKL